MKKLLLIAFVLGFVFPSSAQINRSEIPQAEPMPSIQLKKPEQFKLKNGLQVLIVENHKLPRVSIQLSIDTPPILEGDKAGTSSLLSAMLGKGSASISKDDFIEEVDFLGAQLNFGALSAYGQSLSKVYPRIMELMAEGALNPSFDTAEFEKEKEKIITGLKSNEKSVEAIASRIQRAVAYGKDHPYGEFETPETIEGITIDDVTKFYKEHFVPNNAYLVIIGDIELKEAKKLAKNLFGKWKKADPMDSYQARAKTSDEVAINFVDMPNAKQSVVAVQSLVDLKMSDDDYLDALLANKILGGGSSARLFLNLREDKAYTYGSYASLSNDKYDKARFRAYASVRNAVTDSAVVQLLEEVDRIQNELVSDKELADAKANYIGSFIMDIEKPETIARYALNIATENLPDDFYENYLSRLESVDSKDVLAAAKKYLNINSTQVYVAGKGQEVLEPLENLSFKGRQIPVNYFSKTAKAVPRPSFELELPDGVNAKNVINTYLEAIGGRTLLETIEAISYKAKAEMQGMTLEFSVLKTSDRQYKQSLSMMGNVMSEQVFNGDSGYMTLRGQKMPIPEDQIDKVIQEAQLFKELKLDLDQLKIESIEQIGDQKAYKIGVAEGQFAFYDIKSGLKIMESTTVEMNGQTMETTIKFSDYQDREGIQFPFIFTQQMGPQELEFKVEELKINPTITQGSFN